MRKASGNSDGWKRSSRCGPDGGNCVEIRFDSDGVAVRDSALSTKSPVLAFDQHAWADFLGVCATVRPRTPTN